MISVVIPAFNEASNLPALAERLCATFAALPAETFECVIVDDGSTDETPQVLRRLRDADARFHWVRLAKNGGSHEAIGLGLEVCRGQAAIVLAADLQDPPEVFRELIAHWRSGSDVVWAVRTERPGESRTNRAASLLYYRVMNRLLASPFPSNGADFFLADRKVVDALSRRYQRHAPNVLFQIASLGFRSSTIGYVKRQRHSGKSKWGLKKRVYLFVDSVLAFSPAWLLVTVTAAWLTAGALASSVGWWMADAILVLTWAFGAWRLWLLFSRRTDVRWETSLNEPSRPDEVRSK